MQLLVEKLNSKFSLEPIKILSFNVIDYPQNEIR